MIFFHFISFLSLPLYSSTIVLNSKNENPKFAIKLSIVVVVVVVRLDR